MAIQTFASPCRFNALLPGVVDFGVGSAVAGHDVPENLQVLDGKVYRYYAQSADGSQWEHGEGPYHVTTHKLDRITVYTNSSYTTGKINFAAPPIVDVIVSSPTTLEIGTPFPAGTLMLFQQSAAPAGWVKQTTHNDKALRVVSGTASYGGVNSFSGMFAYRTSDGHTLSNAEMTQHGHSFPIGPNSAEGTYYRVQYGQAGDSGYSSVSTEGYSYAHDHTYDMRVQYVDLIICRKD